MNQQFTEINAVIGELKLPGDKSISHRSLLFSALSKGESTIRNLSGGEDVKSTIQCLKRIGVSILQNNDLCIVYGRGFKGFAKPVENIDAGNSGTTARLISGILAAQDFDSVITGDNSLSRRPMKRIIEPLTEMGAEIHSESGYLPLRILPTKKLKPISYRLLLPSAQVKSAIILTAIHLEEESVITEFIPSRDHTERMLGLRVTDEEGKREIRASIRNYPEAKEYFVPSDISSAVFFIVAAMITPGSRLVIKNVSLNPSRTGILEIFRQMGANITEENIQSFADEPFGDLVIESSSLKNVDIPPEKIPNIIDEIPALAVAGIFAEGNFTISGAEELRHKESDRILALCTNFKSCGLKVEEFIDGFTISGELRKNKFLFRSFGDHRIAMAFAVLSMLTKSGGEVEGFECASISNPLFLEQVKSIVV